MFKFVNNHNARQYKTKYTLFVFCIPFFFLMYVRKRARCTSHEHSRFGWLAGWLGLSQDSQVNAEWIFRWPVHLSLRSHSIFRFFLLFFAFFFVFSFFFINTYLLSIGVLLSCFDFRSQFGQSWHNFCVYLVGKLKKKMKGKRVAQVHHKISHLFFISSAQCNALHQYICICLVLFFRSMCVAMPSICSSFLDV